MPSLHLRTETDPVSETLYFLVFRIPDDGEVQNLSDSECYTDPFNPMKAVFLGLTSVLRIGISEK
jgi:hypothetical protein